MSPPALIANDRAAGLLEVPGDAVHRPALDDGRRIEQAVASVMPDVEDAVALAAQLLAPAEDVADVRVGIREGDLAAREAGPRSRLIGEKRASTAWR